MRIALSIWSLRDPIERSSYPRSHQTTWNYLCPLKILHKDVLRMDCAESTPPLVNELVRQTDKVGIPAKLWWKINTFAISRFPEKGILLHGSVALTYIAQYQANLDEWQLQHPFFTDPCFFPVFSLADKCWKGFEQSASMTKQCESMLHDMSGLLFCRHKFPAVWTYSIISPLLKYVSSAYSSSSSDEKVLEDNPIVSQQYVSSMSSQSNNDLGIVLQAITKAWTVRQEVKTNVSQ